jgi:hypothetical protein
MNVDAAEDATVVILLLLLDAAADDDDADGRVVAVLLVTARVTATRIHRTAPHRTARSSSSRVTRSSRVDRSSSSVTASIIHRASWTTHTRVWLVAAEAANASTLLFCTLLSVRVARARSSRPHGEHLARVVVIFGD